MKELGVSLLEELNQADVEVKYCIDRDADNIYMNIDIFKPDDNLPEVDVVVVTAMHNFEEISQHIEKKLKCKIVSLEDVVWEA